MTGVVGLGAMGSLIAGRLAAATTGRVRVYDADPARTESVAAHTGGRPESSLSGLAECEVLVLSLPTPAVVGSVVADLADAGFGGTVLDTSTIGPDTAREAARVLAASGAAYADCPILGRPGSVGAWTVPVGGPAEVVDLAARVLSPVARTVVRAGEVGAAATLKVLNNLMLGTINAITAEALVVARAAGLDPGAFVDIVAGSGAASVSPMFRDVAARAVVGDFRPTFTLELMTKDTGLALDLAGRHGVALRVGEAVQQVNRAGLEAGLGSEDSIAVIKPMEQATGEPARRVGSRSGGGTAVSGR